MDSAQQVRFEPETVPHPGETVLEYLDFHEWSQRDLARRTGFTPKTISEICNGKTPISPSAALAFEKAFQRPAHLWLNLQRQFDESTARRRELAHIAQWDEWANRFPLKEMKRLRFTLPQRRSDAEVLLNYFGVSSPESWDSVWKAAAVSYRQTRNFTLREESIAAWVRQVELEAERLTLADFDEERLLAVIAELKGLTRESVDRIVEPIQQLCATAGVAVVWVPELRHTGISGCTRWMSDKRVLIGLTFRYKTDDQLWYSFFHELGHVLLHKKKVSFVIDNAEEDLSDRVIDPEMQQYEAEANQFAGDVLVAPRLLAEFIRKGTFTNDSIHDFAMEVGIGPGLVVGRLQHDGFLARHQGNKLKQKISVEVRD